MIAKTKDKSLIYEYNKAVDKIKSVLRNSEKEKVEFLANRTIIGKNWKNEITSNYHNSAEDWVLIAWCRLRKEFRSFRVDRIQQLKFRPEKFNPHQMTLNEYVEIQRVKNSKDE